MEAIKTNIGNLSQQEKEWFSEMIHSIKQDVLCLDAGIADKETKEVYEHLMNGNMLELSKKFNDDFNQVIIKDVMLNFLFELFQKGQEKIKLAFNISGPKLLVWAEINDDDEKAESDLFLSEAKVNAKYVDFDYSISTTVVEKSDYLSAPPHYVDFK